MTPWNQKLCIKALKYGAPKIRLYQQWILTEIKSVIYCYPETWPNPVPQVLETMMDVWDNFT